MPDRVAHISAQQRRHWRRNTALLGLAILLSALWLAGSLVSQSSLALAHE